MTAHDRTPFYLSHMREAIDRALTYTAVFSSSETFAKDSQALDAVVRTIEILGEAANKISQANPDFITAHPDIPWQAMRTMRNKLIHDYFTVDPVVVWQTVKTDLPAVKEKIIVLITQLLQDEEG